MKPIRDEKGRVLPYKKPEPLSPGLSREVAKHFHPEDQPSHVDTYASGRPRPTLQLAIYNEPEFCQRLKTRVKHSAFESVSHLAETLLKQWLAETSG